MIDILKRHEIQVLRRAGHGLDEVAKLAGVGRRSVARVEAEAAVRQFDNQPPPLLLGNATQSPNPVKAPTGNHPTLACARNWAAASRLLIDPVEVVTRQGLEP